MITTIMTFEGAPKQRRDNAEAIAEQIGGKVYVGGKCTTDNFEAILQQCGDEPLLMLEDDVTPCNNFNEVIAKEIAKRPDDIINCHSQLIRGGRYIPLNIYTGLQCVYIPNHAVKDLLEIAIPNFRLRQPNLVKLNDHDKIFQQLEGDYYATRYCLVCQKTWDSEIFHGWVDEHTKWFIDEVNDGKSSLL